MSKKPPVPVQVERLSEYNYLASVTDVDFLNASGDTKEEAVENLYDMIASTHRLLLKNPSGKLGPAMLILLDYLNSHYDAIKVETIKETPINK